MVVSRCLEGRSNLQLAQRSKRGAAPKPGKSTRTCGSRCKMEALHGTGYRPHKSEEGLCQSVRPGQLVVAYSQRPGRTTPVSALRLPSRSRTSLPRLLQSRIHCTARFWTILRAEGRPCSRPLRAISRRCTRQAPKKPSEAKQRPCHKREGSNIGWGHTQTVSEWF